MKDQAVPTFNVNTGGISVDIVITDTQALSYEQGHTYNEVGLTYNQAGVAYGGAYNLNTDELPILTSASQVTPSMIINSSQALLEEQNITYNQAGISYNQAGVAYGGIYNTNQDVIPLINMASSITPTITGFDDIYTPKPTPPAAGKNAPGWFMFLNLT